MTLYRIVLYCVYSSILFVDSFIVLVSVVEDVICSVSSVFQSIVLVRSVLRVLRRSLLLLPGPRSSLVDPGGATCPGIEEGTNEHDGRVVFSRTVYSNHSYTIRDNNNNNNNNNKVVKGLFSFRVI